MCKYNTIKDRIKDFVKRVFKNNTPPFSLNIEELEPVSKVRAFGDTTHTFMVVNFDDRSYTADRWFKNGDHSLDEQGVDPQLEGRFVRRFRHPAYTGGDRCPHCGYTYDEHGFIDMPKAPNNGVVCPGDWVLFDEENENIAILTNEVFVALYDPAGSHWCYEVCKECGKRNTVGFNVPDHIWKAVVGEGVESVHCLSCFDKKAQEKGVKYAHQLQIFVLTWEDTDFPFN